MDTAQGGTQTCGERTCTPFDQLSHSGTPRPEWRIWQATAGFLARGSSPAPPSRANDPVVFGAGFPLTVAGAAPASLKTREPVPCLSRPVFPLSPVRRPDTVGYGTQSDGNAVESIPLPMYRRAGCCREGVPVILSPPRELCRRTS